MTTEENRTTNDKRGEHTLPQRNGASNAAMAIDASLNALLLGLVIIMTVLATALIAALLAWPELVFSPHGMALLGEHGFWIRLALGAILALVVALHSMNVIKAMRRAQKR